MRSVVLGLGGSNHDFSAAIVIDGKIVVAIEEERLDRIKHGTRRWNTEACELSINYCLEAEKLSVDDITSVFSNLDHLRAEQPVLGKIVQKVDHHLAHAAASFFTAPFEASAVLVVDGHGARPISSNEQNVFQTVSMGHANATGVRIDKSVEGSRMITTLNWHYIVSNSLGSFYKLVSELIGFGMHGTGKTMGLAAYGEKTLVGEMKQWLHVENDTQVIFDPYSGLSDWVTDVFRRNGNAAQTRANIARAAQEVFEETLLILARHTHRLHRSRNLSYGGGCALNTVANRRLLEETPFENLHIYPAAGDAGLAVGAALLGAHQNGGIDRSPFRVASLSKVAFTGRKYSEDQLTKALDNAPVLYRRTLTPVADISNWLADGEIVGVFRGRSEIGPRALGHRSIFANPSSGATLRRINTVVKHRESFRPLAPVVPFDRVSDYFDLDVDSPFMLLIANVRPKYRSFLRAVTHVDGTARVQTVRREADTFLYDLLLDVERHTGHPVIVNTSFNRRNEPLVETPEQALECFLEQELEYLFLDGYIVEKHSPWAFQTD